MGAGFSRPITAIVLELVEGDTLADVIARSPIDLDDAPSIARQIFNFFDELRRVAPSSR